MRRGRTPPLRGYLGVSITGGQGRPPLRMHYWWCVGEGLSCPPSCQPTDGHCRTRQSGHFLETGSLHPPLAALRRFPLLRAIRIPVPKAPCRKGVFLRDGGIFSQIHKKFSLKLQMQLLRVEFLWYTTSTARKTGCGPNHNKEELYNEKMGMFCLRLCVRG